MWDLNMTNGVVIVYIALVANKLRMVIGRFWLINYHLNEWLPDNETHKITATLTPTPSLQWSDPYSLFPNVWNFESFLLFSTSFPIQKLFQMTYWWKSKLKIDYISWLINLNWKLTIRKNIKNIINFVETYPFLKSFGFKKKQ